LELIRSTFNLIILKSFYDHTRSQDEFRSRCESSTLQFVTFDGVTARDFVIA